MTEFRAPAAELARFRLRVVVAAVFVLVCFGLLAARFHHLQVKRHDYFLTRAEDNRIALLPVVPHRGTIVDRHGVVLARNYATYTIEITPSQVRDLDATLDELAGLLPLDARDRRRFRKLYEESRNFESVPLRSRLTDEEVARVVSQRYRLPGVDVKARLLRDYPQGSTASHVIGYIGRITERDVERIEEAGNAANYRGTLHMGKAGLEQSYEHELHGTTGFEQVEVNAGGRAVRALSHTAGDTGQRPRADPRHRAAEGGREGLRRSPRRAGGDRAGHRRRARAGLDADLRPQPLRRRHLYPGLEGAQRFARPSDAAPRDLFHLSARLDLQALHGARRPRDREAHREAGHVRRRLLPVRRPPLHGRQDRRPRHGGSAQVDRGVVQHLLLPARQRPRHRRHRGLHGALRLRRAHRHRPAGRSDRHPAFAGVEAESLQEARAAALVCRRDDLGRHRPGLQRLHAAAARQRARGAGQPGQACSARTWSSTWSIRAPASGARSSPSRCARSRCATRT
ncbi:hypothetical protein MASR2M50_35200 [Thauera sp.]